MAVGDGHPDKVGVLAEFLSGVQEASKPNSGTDTEAPRGKELGLKAVEVVHTADPPLHLIAHQLLAKTWLLR